MIKYYYTCIRRKVAGKAGCFKTRLDVARQHFAKLHAGLHVRIDLQYLVKPHTVAAQAAAAGLKCRELFGIFSKIYLSGSVTPEAVHVATHGGTDRRPAEGLRPPRLDVAHMPRTLFSAGSTTASGPRKEKFLFEETGATSPLKAL